jgi:hypothetical protein
LVVGFLAVDEGWQHEPSAGLAELVLGLLAVIAGLLPVIAGLGVPFHGSMALSCMRLRQSKAGCRGNVHSSGKFSLAMPPIAPKTPSSSTNPPSGASGRHRETLARLFA